MSGSDYALLFDCDGVIVETEELHRLAYNAAFDKFKLRLPDGSPVVWDVQYYDILQNTVGGGKPKMNYYFKTTAKSWPICGSPYKRAPSTEEEKQKLVDMLQDAKTEFYKSIIDNMASARDGVLELMDEAIARKDIKVSLSIYERIIIFILLTQTRHVTCSLRFTLLVAFRWAYAPQQLEAASTRS